MLVRPVRYPDVTARLSTHPRHSAGLWNGTLSIHAFHVDRPAVLVLLLEPPLPVTLQHAAAERWLRAKHPVPQGRHTVAGSAIVLIGPLAFRRHCTDLLTTSYTNDHR